ncbi:DUF1674 domain-containing protein [Methylogaea oryzae]|uniref:DUF1674 domain-containing protein n=1 Tax=Methylogaea oryzae TaxID=1295382 RepID=UPI0009EC0AAD
MSKVVTPSPPPQDHAGQAGPTGSGALPPTQPTAPNPLTHNPTRYGDWERNGRCIDF